MKIRNWHRRFVSFGSAFKTESHICLSRIFGLIDFENETITDTVVIFKMVDSSCLFCYRF